MPLLIWLVDCGRVNEKILKGRKIKDGKGYSI
jgi:hypothetical protein